MKGALENYKRTLFNTPNLLIYFVLIVAFTLTGCGSQDEATTDSDNITLQIPDFASRLDPVAGNLTATIEFSGQFHPMDFSGDGSTASINSLSKPDVNTPITIVFTYDLDPYGPLVVASATKPYDGRNTFDFAAVEYDTESYDADGDTISNLEELQVTPAVANLCNSINGVIYGGRCYYLDGTGGVCLEPGFELAPQSILFSMATKFAGKRVRDIPQSNCCIRHADENTEAIDWGLQGPDCFSPGIWADGPSEGGSSCMDESPVSSTQLTLCQTSCCSPI